MASLGSVGNSSFSPEKKEEAPAASEPVLSELDLALAEASEYFGSRDTSDHTQALKILLSMISKGYDVSEFAPLVVQECVSSDSLGKQLAYVFLNHYADDALDSIVLSINTFQRTLSDPDPLCRALAIKTMSSIRSKEVLACVKDAIMQVSGDTSPYVRKVAAYAIVKAAELTESQSETEEFLPILERLLNDDDPVAFSGAIAAYWSLCPDNIDLLHPRFRFMCTYLNSFDVWGQVYTIRSLTIYARYCFQKPSIPNEDESEVGFWDGSVQAENLVADHNLLVSSVKKVLQSPSPSVVLAAVALFYYCAPPSQMSCIARPLVRLLYESQVTAEIALSTMTTIASTYPHIFIPHLNHFYIRKNDTQEVKNQKLRLLSILASTSNVELILAELLMYTGSTNEELAASSVKAMGKIALQSTSLISQCLSYLVKLLGRAEGKILSEVVLVIAHLLKQNRGTQDEAQTLKQLSRKFIAMKDPTARSAVLCIVGDMHKIHPEFAPQLLRHIGKNYNSEPAEVRLQAMTLAAKVISIGVDSKVPMYIIRLGERDAEFDVRNRARFFSALISSKAEKMHEKLSSFLFSSRKTQTWAEKENEESGYQIGTLSNFFNHELSGYEALPDWAPVESLPEEKVRWPKYAKDAGKDDHDDDDDSVEEKVAYFFSGDEENDQKTEYEEEEQDDEEEEDDDNDEAAANHPDVDQDDEDDFFS